MFADYAFPAYGSEGDSNGDYDSSTYTWGKPLLNSGLSGERSSYTPVGVMSKKRRAAAKHGWCWYMLLLLLATHLLQQLAAALAASPLEPEWVDGADGMRLPSPWMTLYTALATVVEQNSRLLTASVLAYFITTHYWDLAALLLEQLGFGLLLQIAGWDVDSHVEAMEFNSSSRWGSWLDDEEEDDFDDSELPELEDATAAEAAPDKHKQAAAAAHARRQAVLKKLAAVGNGGVAKMPRPPGWMVYCPVSRELRLLES
eukprot:PLAT13209.1.p1 GENE.PLAT13209.1~~PLAT13209.1.p1  ORF type:complete len:289 (+),score=156.93 PLAT13209.1:94-867(+)